MPRSRISLRQAALTGRLQHDPQRFRDRKEPKNTEPLGPPPHWLSAAGKSAFKTFGKDLPWLNKSHRGIVSIASLLHGKVASGEDINISGLNLLRLCLSQLGATPADASKIALPDEPDNEADPAAAYF